METIYYRLNAARITVEGDRKVSGGEEVRCVVLPKKVKPAPAEGKVLDFEAYRRALEPEAVSPVEEDAEPEEAPAPKRSLSPWILADVCASAAVVLCTALAALGVLLG